MIKKYLKFIIPASLILLIGIILILVFNIPRLTYSYSEEHNAYFVKNAFGNASEYEIKEEHKGLKVVGIDERAFYNHTKLESIYLPPSVKIIKRLAFSECDKLESINLENVDTIYRNAFSYCTSLDNIVLDAQFIGASSFFKCISLHNITLLENVYDIGSMAFAFTAIESIDIPRNVSSLENDCFYKCENLNSIIVNGGNLIANEYLKELDNVIFKFE